MNNPRGLIDQNNEHIPNQLFSILMQTILILIHSNCSPFYSISFHKCWIWQPAGFVVNHLRIKFKKINLCNGLKFRVELFINYYYFLLCFRPLLLYSIFSRPPFSENGEKKFAKITNFAGWPYNSMLNFNEGQMKKWYEGGN
jgi:hypothetical protein